MAKSKSFFGLRTGSTKSLTFQVYRGQQITKDRVTRISNPRSEAQMKQRAIIPIVAASRAALKGLVNHSFEGIPYGEQSLKMFSSLNLKAGALTVASYAPNGYSNPGFANLIVSHGTININSDEIKSSNPYISAVYNVNKETLQHKAYKAGEPAAGLLRDLATWAASENVEICKPGTQLTFLTVNKAGEFDDPKAPLSAFHIDRILFPSDNTSDAQVKDVNGQWTIQKDVSENFEEVFLTNPNKDIIFIDLYGSRLYFKLRPYGYEKPIGIAVIVSKYVNGTWKRNNARIGLLNLDTPYTYEQWKAVYEKTGASAKYLNQGNEGTGIA